MAYENNDKKIEGVYSQRLRAGKRRTYFFDIRETRGNDFYLTITESRKKFDSDGYDRHKIFVYKEDFNKFLKSVGEAMDFVKTELMPDYDFDAFNHDTPYEGDGEGQNNQNNAAPSKPLVEEVPVAETKIDEIAPPTPEPPSSSLDNGSAEEVDKW